MTPKIGLTGQAMKNAGGGPLNPVAGVITKVNGNGTVDVEIINGSGVLNDVPFVDVSATPPASGQYFQAIDAVN